MVLSEETVKQIFFYSDKPVKDALLADEVDIVQFANNVAQFVKKQYAVDEHARCVKIVRDMNPEVARALDNQKPR
jgi:hypothetical protein